MKTRQTQKFLAGCWPIAVAANSAPYTPLDCWLHDHPAYSLVDDYKRRTGAPLVRSICIDGNLGFEGVSYRPNNHSGFLTHAIFAWTNRRDLGGIKQLVGRVNGIVDRNTWTGCTVFIPSSLTYYLTFAALVEPELLAFHRMFPGEELNINNPAHPSQTIG